MSESSDMKIMCLFIAYASSFGKLAVDYTVGLNWSPMKVLRGFNYVTGLHAFCPSLMGLLSVPSSNHLQCVLHFSLRRYDYMGK